MKPSNALGDYGSHFPVLAAMVARTEGPVLELGCGHWSTPMLHLMCAGRRKLVSLETDCAWLENFLHWESPDHEFHHIDHSDITKIESRIDGARAAQDEPLVQTLQEEAKTVKNELLERWLSLLREVTKADTCWSVAFVDHRPGEARAASIEFLKDKAQFILAHDSERDHGSGGNYGYENVAQKFKYQYEFRMYRPYTLVLSDFEDPVFVGMLDKYVGHG